MAGGDAIITLPDGHSAFGPVDPRTWASAERYRARLLETDVAGAIAWHRNRPFFQGLQLGAQSISTSTWNLVDLDWEMIDAWSGHSGADYLWFAPDTLNNTNNPSDYYLCSGYVPMNASDSTKVGIAGIIKNGSEIHEGTKLPQNSGHVIDPIAIDLIGVTSGDTLSLGAWTNVAAGATTVVSAKTPSLTARWVGAAVGYVSPLPPVPHSWIPADLASASSTGASPTPGGSKVPLNTEIRDLIRFLNYPPLARLTAEGGSQAIPSSTSVWTPIQFPLANIDTYGGWSSGDNTKYTFQRPGVYLVIGRACIAEASSGSNDGYRAVRLQVNGDAAKVYGGTSAIPQSSGSTGTALYVARHIRVSAGDYVQVQMQQNQSAGTTTRAVNTTASAASKLIAIWRGR